MIQLKNRPFAGKAPTTTQQAEFSIGWRFCPVYVAGPPAGRLLGLVTIRRHMDRGSGRCLAEFQEDEKERPSENSLLSGNGLARQGSSGKTFANASVISRAVRRVAVFWPVKPKRKEIWCTCVSNGMINWRGCTAVLQIPRSTIPSVRTIQRKNIARRLQAEVPCKTGMPLRSAKSCRNRKIGSSQSRWRLF